MTQRVSQGLGINMPVPKPPVPYPTSSRKPSTLRGILKNADLPPRLSAQSQGGVNDNDSLPVLRSVTSMNGLQLAERGASMVEKDVFGEPGTSGFRLGQSIEPTCVSPDYGPQMRTLPRTAASSASSDSLLDFPCFPCSPRQSSTELCALLGGSGAHLKPKSAISTGSTQSTCQLTSVHGVPMILERAKSRSRIDLDIELESEVCVQGAHLRGTINLHVRKCVKKEAPLLLSQARIHVIGFECMSLADNISIFYQCRASLSDVSGSFDGLFTSATGPLGWKQAREGKFDIPFAMILPMDDSYGVPKGKISFNSGVSVRYIVMVSIVTQDPLDGKRSIAHFYRDCEVWPYLNITTILSPSSRPLLAETNKNVFMGGSGRIKLSARLHRLYWVSGQRCTVHLCVSNGTRKAVTSAAITLIRTSTVFRPREEHTVNARLDLDECQTSTISKSLTESVLEMGHQSSRGHASAKGWWMGIDAGHNLEFAHFIILPPDSVSIRRTRLLEVEYTLRVSVSTGSLASDVHVVLPIRIVNFVSLDPPPAGQPEHTSSQPPTHPACNSFKHQSWYRKSRIPQSSAMVDETIPGMKYSAPDMETQHIVVSEAEFVPHPDQFSLDISADSVLMYPPSDRNSYANHKGRTQNEEVLKHPLDLRAGDTSNYRTRELLNSGSNTLSPTRYRKGHDQGGQLLTAFGQRVRDKLQASLAEPESTFPLCDRAATPSPQFLQQRNIGSDNSNASSISDDKHLLGTTMVSPISPRRALGSKERRSVRERALEFEKKISFIN